MASAAKHKESLVKHVHVFNTVCGQCRKLHNSHCKLKNFPIFDIQSRQIAGILTSFKVNRNHRKTTQLGILVSTKPHIAGDLTLRICSNAQFLNQEISLLHLDEKKILINI